MPHHLAVPTVEQFAWDDANEEKVWVHGLRARDVDEILDSRFAVFANRRGARGAYQVVGRTFQGRYVTVIIEASPLGLEGVWRVVTAWQSKLAEISRARKLGV